MPKPKTSPRSTKRKKTTAKKTFPKQPAQKKRAAKEERGKRKPARKKAAAKSKAMPKKKTIGKSPAIRKATSPAKPEGRAQKKTVKKPVARESQIFETEAPALQERRTRSAGQAGDMQGLSDRSDADSESVDELLEEGNAFEAGVVSGVEAADDADEKEVRTHEVPEDDVPGEYLDEE
jgi:hypothetical protein